MKIKTKVRAGLVAAPGSDTPVGGSLGGGSGSGGGAPGGSGRLRCC